VAAVPQVEAEAAVVAVTAGEVALLVAVIVTAEEAEAALVTVAMGLRVVERQVVPAGLEAAALAALVLPRMAEAAL
jgi:hypothetical protein